MSALHVDIEDGIAVVTFDLPGEPVNKFSSAVIGEIDAILDSIEGNSAVKGAVVISGKADGFIAGADIDEFLTFKTAAVAAAMSADGKKRFERIERFRVPIVAAIHGACMGGGLELALACRYRIATDHPKTILALPETQLGLIPGLGGTQRLPRLVGMQAALDMILTGKNVRAKKALQTGLIDEMVHPGILRAVAINRAKWLGKAGPAPPASVQSRAPRGRAAGIAGLLLDATPIGRAIVARQAGSMSAKKARGNYPALPAAIRAVAAGFGPPADGYALESHLFGELAMTAVSRELINLFFATTAIKKDAGATAGRAPRDVSRLAVLGTGFMGAGIAAVAAQAGVPVRFKDVKREQVGRGLAAVRDVLKERLKKRQVTKQEFDDQMSLVAPTTEYTGFHGASLVIEAVFEDIAVKHQVLRDVEPLLSADAIFATNTSTIPITKVAEAAHRPERVVGMHFFSPVHKMPLLEVITTARTAPDVVATAAAFGRRLGKTVVVVHDSPGFFVNRILAPYLNEAGRLLDEGASIDEIDRAMLDWGFPVGPITLLDEVGLDIASKSGAILSAAFGDRLRPSQSLGRMVESGRLGRKAKKGFYRYDESGKRLGVDEWVYQLSPAGATRRHVAPAEIQERLSLAMINEAVRCLEEGVVRHPRDGDLAAIFGIGFPPFRGGPFRCVDAMGAAKMAQALEALDSRHTGRFAPAARLVQIASKGGKVYDGF